MTRSAGLLLYRRAPQGVELLLVHPGGPFWRGRDLGAWSIPKGEVDPEEDPLRSAQREFTEEMGLPAPEGPYVPLGAVRQRAGKEVLAWACAGDLDPGEVVSNTFTVEWPPRSGRRVDFPEIDEAAWFTPEAARRKLNPAQAEFVDRLLAHLVG